MTTAWVLAQAKRKPDRTRLTVTLLRVGVVVAVGLVWEGVSRFGILNPSEFPPISVVAVNVVTTLLDAGTWVAIGNTLLGWLIGMLISIVLGVGLGLLIGPSRFMTRSTSLMIDVLRSTPAPAIIFILILLLGTTLPMKVALVAFAAVFPILIQSLYGVRSVDTVLKDLQRSYRIGRLTGFLRIRLPAALPYIATGVRVSASLALIVAVVAEYLGGAAGVGHLVDRVRIMGDFPRMYALILIVGLLSIGLNAIVRLGEASLLRWHPSHRKAS